MRLGNINYVWKLAHHNFSDTGSMA